ncbi:FUSC family protein [Rhodococcus antarcticus]|uniref:FUSC family protein n=1 Tax=Rhodococcus antarcticus TaxID=2987751 RepID=A0ABY6P0P5_9NOCA|nr:FUSC family protein [Rhodococcus antarcticus]UZJ25215.1 FUSC family protein [Rhodococcus antarcticus]
MRTRPSLLRRAVRSLAAEDPGQVRLTSAATTTLTLVLALAVLILLTRTLGQPITVALLGTVVAMFSAVAVQDRTHRARVVSTALTPLPAIASAGLAAVLHPYGVVADLGFVAVLFTATWVRRYGPRGNALGQVAFTAYFFVLFLRASTSQLPALAASVLVGVAVALVVRVVLLPERPRTELRRLTRALRAVCASAVGVAVAGSRSASAAGTVLDDAPLRRQLTRLGDTALMIEDWLDRHDAARHLSVDGRELSLRVLDGQLATEQLVATLAALPPGTTWPPELDTVLAALDTVLRDEPGEEQLRGLLVTVGAAAHDVDVTTPTGRAVFTAARAVRAHASIHRVSEQVVAAAEREDPAPVEGTDTVDAPPGLHPATRAAVQVAVATALATGLGELISPNRWYWAVLAAFVVFNGTTSRGQILSRASQRVLGTLGGVVAGVLLAAVVGRNAPLQLGLIVVCVFAAFYLVRVSSALMVFFITVLLAMLYGLLGTFSVQVLELRIYETAAGAAVGIAAAFLVLPTGTRSTVDGKLRACLDSLDDLVRDSVAAVGSGGGEVDLVTASRDLDDTLVALDLAAEPLAHGVLQRVRTSTRLWLRVVRAADGYARSLARAGHAAAAVPAPTVEVAEALAAAATRVHEHVGALRARLDSDHPAPVHPAEPALVAVLELDGRGVHDPEVRPLRAAVYALARIDRALLDLLEVAEEPVGAARLTG